MSTALKNLIQTGGWKEVEKIFDKEIASCMSPFDIDERLDDKTFAREVRARAIAGKAMRQLINNIKLAAGGDPVKKISYK